MGLPVNAAHWHLVLNHTPIFLVIIGLLVLITGMATDSFDLKTTSLVLFFAAGVIVIPVYYTGEEAEDIAEQQPAFSEQSMEAHEEAGATSRNLVILLGILALAGAGIYFWQDELPNWYLGILIVIGAISAYWLISTATLGGKIQHPELRETPTSLYSPGE